MALSFSKWKNIFPISAGSENGTTSSSHSAATNEDGANNNVESKIRKFKASRKGMSGADKSDAEVGFRLILDPIGTTQITTSGGPFEIKQSVAVPELNINIIGARQLPSSFGLKSVEGYMIKVKLFPGTTRHDTSVQTNSWPKFNETFKFPLAPALKSSIRSRTKNDLLARSLPERLFKGHFVVLTVFALLDLPPGTLNPLVEKYQTFKRKGSLMLKEKKIIAGAKDVKKESGADKEKEKTSVINLTPSESRRNIGSVTCFLDPKIFTENPKTGHFCTEEFWLPVKDINATPSSGTASNSNQLSSPQNTKGQLEVTLHICAATEPVDELLPDNGNSSKSAEAIKKSKNTKKSDKKTKKPDPNTNPFRDGDHDDDDDHGDEVVERDPKRVDIFRLNSADFDPDAENKMRHSFDTNRNVNDGDREEKMKPRSWSFGDMKKKIARIKKDKQKVGKCLKVTINRMRCSIKVKEDFENIAGDEIYLKMTIFERDILSETWKSKSFAPTLSYRWEARDSSISIPLVNDYDVEYMSVKITVATKKVGKKIVLGTLLLGPKQTGESLDHWNETISGKGSPITKWHNFE